MRGLIVTFVTLAGCTVAAAPGHALDFPDFLSADGSVFCEPKSRTLECVKLPEALEKDEVQRTFSGVRGYVLGRGGPARSLQRDVVASGRLLRASRSKDLNVKNDWFCRSLQRGLRCKNAKGHGFVIGPRSRTIKPKG